MSQSFYHYLQLVLLYAFLSRLPFSLSLARSLFAAFNRSSRNNFVLWNRPIMRYYFASEL